MWPFPEFLTVHSVTQNVFKSQPQSYAELGVCVSYAYPLSPHHQLNWPSLKSVEKIGRFSPECCFKFQAFQAGLKESKCFQVPKTVEKWQTIYTRFLVLPFKWSSQVFKKNGFSMLFEFCVNVTSEFWWSFFCLSKLHVFCLSNVWELFTQNWSIFPWWLFVCPSVLVKPNISHLLLRVHWGVICFLYFR